MYRTLQDFVDQVEGKLLRSLTKEEWEFTRWMYQRYEYDTRQEGIRESKEC